MGAVPCESSSPRERPRSAHLLNVTHSKHSLARTQDRKQVLKVLKPHIERMCIDDEAQLVLFTALDVIESVTLRLVFYLSRFLTLNLQ